LYRKNFFVDSSLQFFIGKSVLFNYY